MDQRGSFTTWLTELSFPTSSDAVSRRSDRPQPVHLGSDAIVTETAPACVVPKLLASSRALDSRSHSERVRDGVPLDVVAERNRELESSTRRRDAGASSPPRSRSRSSARPHPRLRCPGACSARSRSRGTGGLRTCRSLRNRGRGSRSESRCAAIPCPGGPRSFRSPRGSSRIPRRAPGRGGRAGRPTPRQAGCRCRRRR